MKVKVKVSYIVRKLVVRRRVLIRRQVAERRRERRVDTCIFYSLTEVHLMPF